jgi:hypothetical protein
MLQDGMTGLKSAGCKVNTSVIIIQKQSKVTGETYIDDDFCPANVPGQ